MKRTVFVCSLILAMAIAVTAAAPGGQKGKTVPRDISGIMDGRFIFAGEGNWETWTTTGDLTGTLKHLGLAKMYTTHQTDGASIWGGTFEIVAANGDEIQGTYTASGGWISDTQVLGTAALAITGGTGRFAGASGTITAAFLETFDDPTYFSAKVSWVLDGTVKY